MEKNQEQGGAERGERTGRRAPGLEDDRLYRALASRPRRRLLYYLSDIERATVDELADVLVGWETSQRGGMATEAARDRTETELRHSHLPTLADAGLVTYDRQTGRVECAPLDTAVSDLLTRSVAAETE